MWRNLANSFSKSERVPYPVPATSIRLGRSRQNGAKGETGCSDSLGAAPAPCYSPVVLHILVGNGSWAVVAGKKRIRYLFQPEIFPSVLAPFWFFLSFSFFCLLTKNSRPQTQIIASPARKSHLHAADDSDSCVEIDHSEKCPCLKPSSREPLCAAAMMR